MVKPQIRLPLGLILAGGAGRRMGGADKALLTLAGQPLLAQVAARLAPQTAGMVLSAAPPAARYQAVVPGLPVLEDPLPGGLGPLAGLLAGLGYGAAHGYDHVLSVAVDTPFFPPGLGQRLRTALPDGPAGLISQPTPRTPTRPAPSATVAAPDALPGAEGGSAADPAPGAALADVPVLAASASGLHPTFGLWPVGLVVPLRDYLLSGQRRLREFAQNHGARIVLFDSDPLDPFFNINTPDDLVLAQKRMPGTETG